MPEIATMGFCHKVSVPLHLFSPSMEKEQIKNYEFEYEDYQQLNQICLWPLSLFFKEINYELGIFHIDATFIPEPLKEAVKPYQVVKGMAVTIRDLRLSWKDYKTDPICIQHIDCDPIKIDVETAQDPPMKKNLVDWDKVYISYIIEFEHKILKVYKRRFKMDIKSKYTNSSHDDTLIAFSVNDSRESAAEKIMSRFDIFLSNRVTHSENMEIPNDPAELAKSAIKTKLMEYLLEHVKRKQDRLQYNSFQNKIHSVNNQSKLVQDKYQQRMSMESGSKTDYMSKSQDIVQLKDNTHKLDEENYVHDYQFSSKEKEVGLFFVSVKTKETSETDKEEEFKKSRTHCNKGNITSRTDEQTLQENQFQQKHSELDADKNEISSQFAMDGELFLREDCKIDLRDIKEYLDQYSWEISHCIVGDVTLPKTIERRPETLQILSDSKENILSKVFSKICERAECPPTFNRETIKKLFEMAGTTVPSASWHSPEVLRLLAKLWSVQ